MKNPNEILSDISECCLIRWLGLLDLAGQKETPRPVTAQGQGVWWGCRVS
jgi:hypothetical protein